MTKPVEIKADPLPAADAAAIMKQDIKIRRSEDPECPLALAIEKALILLSVPLAPPQDVK
ncbi:hypothetical protein [Sphingobium limneticum]|uniref:Uncharacterized protein n=1 Tax=Sphingobium limneticum TaxID=1007511 RepID=A0A5J5HPD1_9SPHN|nr:hypothetical protein [Sphingobium limneticum]KAA9010937.1 hypothetical protein F4U96_24055 [Sphingobium limneticum]KAA9023024.1 hypothetical protein F4U95_23980 [Sphingobium limneticum]